MKKMPRTFAAALLCSLSLDGAQAAGRNWIDNYIASHGHCQQQPSGPYTTLNPFEKPIAEWTDGDLVDLKAALDRCDAKPEAETGGSRIWTGPLYERFASLVHDQRERASQQQAAQEYAQQKREQDEVTRQHQATLDRAASEARIADLKRQTEQEALDRKASEERAAASALEQKEATRLADEAEAHAKAVEAEARARMAVEEAKQRVIEANRQASRFEPPPNSVVAIPETKHPTNQTPETLSVAGIDATTRCSFAVQAYDHSQADVARQIDQFIDAVMRHADQLHVAQGQGSMIANMSVDGYSDIRTITISQCRQHPSESILAASKEIYEGIRGAQSAMGVR